MRKTGARADVEVVDARLLEPAADAHDVLDAVSTAKPRQELARGLFDADLEAEAEVCADLGANGAHDLAREPRAVLERSAVLIRACVDRRAQELCEQHPVRARKLDAVEARLPGPPGGGRELVDHVPDLGDRQRPAGETADGLGVVRRAQRRLVPQPRQDALPAREDELDDVLAVVLVDSLSEFTPERDLVVGVQVCIAGDDVPAFMDRGVRRDDRPDSAPRELQVPVNPCLRARAVVVVEAAGDARTEDAVLDREVRNVERLEDDALGAHRTHPAGLPAEPNAAEIPRWRRCLMASSLICRPVCPI